MSSKAIPVAVLAALLLLIACWSLFHRREVRIFPQTQFTEESIYFYTDSADGGKSTCKPTLKDKQLHFTMQLQEGSPYPYIGMGLDLSKRDSTGRITQFLDLDGFDSLHIRFRSARSEELRIQLLTQDPAFTRPESPMTQRFLVQSFVAERGWTTKSLYMGDFSIPEWWFKLNNLRADPANRFLSNTAALEIQNGARMPLGISDTVEIAEIVFVGERKLLSWILMAIALLLVSGFGFLTWLERERLRTEQALQLAQRRSTALEGAEKLPLSSHRTDDAKRILDFIGKNYQDSELDLEKVCHETGVNRNRLSAILKDEVGGTFKTYLTELRLKEACRALTETDLQVTEIAFQVGFGNVSHFNRVFKERFTISPNEYRKSQTQGKTKSQENP